MGLLGCASTATVVHPDGSSTVVKAGFGNKLTCGNVIAEPAQTVVDSGERIGSLIITTASEQLMAKLIDNVTSASQ
jgi:hypothetical protein